MIRLLSLIASVLICATAIASKNFLAIADIHYGDKNSSMMGHDTGDTLWAQALITFKQLSPSVDFILMLGDLPTHGANDPIQKSKFEQRIFNDLYQADTAHKPMFYITGNNDSLAGNYQKFSKNGRSPLNNAHLWQGACAYCQDLIIDNSHMYRDGYYSSYVIPGNDQIILIAINANLFVHRGFFFSYDLTQKQDADTEIKWIANQLQQHHAKQLLVAMHEEMGVDYHNNPVWQADYANQLITLFNRYQHHFQQITLLAAHTHYDELRKLTLANGRAIYSYSTPAISQIHFNNPAMKIFSLNQAYRISDFTTYYTKNSSYWTGNSYSAIKKTNTPVFSTCNQGDLAYCLDSLTKEQICAFLTSNFIYTVKNTLKQITNCTDSYVIN